MFVNEIIIKKHIASTSYGPYINIVMPYHQVLKLNNLDHYII